MAKRRTMVSHLKDWWWLYGVGSVLCSAIVLWGNIPPRLAKAEEQIDDLKGWSKELMGYTRAMQEQQHVQQAPPQPWDFIRQEGDWQVFRDPDGQLQCCDGTQCIPHPPKGRCPS